MHSIFHNFTIDFSSGLLSWKALSFLIFIALFFLILFVIYIQQRRKEQGLKLQSKLVWIFSLVSMVPTVLVTLFAVLFLYMGVQSWFDTRVSQALSESVAVAESYLAEHKKTIRADAVAMAHVLNRYSLDIAQRPSLLQNIIDEQTQLRSLVEVIIYQPSQNHILAKSTLSFSFAFENPPFEAIEKASKGQVVVLDDEDGDRIRVLVKLEGFLDSYLLVGRFVDSSIIAHIASAKGSTAEYLRLKTNINALQWQFSFIFIVVVLVLLLLSIWYGFYFSKQLVLPIRDLMAVTEKVKEGNFTIRVIETIEKDELNSLGKAFNRMTEQLDLQHQALIKTNRELDERRRLSEAVLSGVSTGIIALTHTQHITLFNPSALRLLYSTTDELLGHVLHDAIPEMNILLLEAEKRPDRPASGEVKLTRGRHSLTFLVRIAAELSEENATMIEGYVITFDDITALLSAQRRAAWADVGRRIAHEIKNPLTPIQLAAERLKQKYRHEITSDPELFVKYTDTIMRHVSTIGTMVEEFVRFARMPAPVFAEEKIEDIISSVILAQECAFPHIDFTLHTLSSRPSYLLCDQHQMTQVLVNLLKNAAESIQETQDIRGIIHLTLCEEKEECVIILEDNGKGFPPDLLDHITEPYITTRTKGTGLGLAIVKKIMEDHHGFISFANTEKGALVTLRLPLITPHMYDSELKESL